MSLYLNQIPIFEELRESHSILLAGAGGGFDIYSGIPLYFNLKKQGKKVILANYSFTILMETTSECVFPYCYKVKGGDRDLSGLNYFPEKYLQQWFAFQGENVELYGFEKTGVIPLRNAYKYLIDKHGIDTVILIDGGTDSLMFGDEEGLGTPQEDICSMAAVYRTGIRKQFLISVGFGIDHFHGVSHYRFLENVAKLANEGGYLGLFQLTREMAEAEKYIDAVNFANEKMSERKSIVSNSIASALEAKFGDSHRTERTVGSELWINPLMTIYWNFDLRAVIKKVMYYDRIKDVNSLWEFSDRLEEFRSELKQLRERKGIPL